MKIKSLLPTITLIFCIAIQNQSAAVIFNDGEVHTIDYTIAGDVDVYDGSIPLLPDITTVILVEGGYIGGSLELYENSHVSVLGGTVEENTELSGNSRLHVSGGQLTEDLELINNSLAIITGGVLLDRIETYENSSVIITGGNLGMSLSACDNSRMTIYGTDFTIDGVPVGYGPIPVNMGLLSGTLANGDKIIETLFDIILTADIILAPKPGSIIYVDDDATGTNTGSSWADAFNYLQDALTVAGFNVDVNEIRIAQGIYKPDEGANQTPGERTATFQLINGVTIKGGYAGAGTPNPDEREPSTYETILSGDIDDNDISFIVGENSHHVVTSSCNEPNTILDGFIITAGCASESPEWYGGGLFCDKANLTIRRCKFIMNHAEYGGGIYNDGSNLELIDCLFSDNSGWDAGGLYNKEGNINLADCSFKSNMAHCHAYGGGGICNNFGTVRLTNCTFIDNECRVNGGGITNWKGIVELTGCTFSNNMAESGRGGGIYCPSCMFVSMTLTKCIFSGNSARWYGGGMWDENGNSTLSDCTFTGNSAEVWGGGMYGAGTLTNCAFIGNMTDGYGGAMYGGGKLTNCAFINNTASSGGGLYGYGTFTNCIFIGNRADGDGGATKFSGVDWTITLTNCSFSGNLADDAGCIYSDANLAVANCILWDNTTMSTDHQVYLGRHYIGGLIPIEVPATMTVNYSDIQEGQADIYGGVLNWGTGNIDADPCFINPGYRDINDVWMDGDYHLLPDSPCIDAGDNNSIPPDTTDLDGDGDVNEPIPFDLDGNPRIADGDNDGIPIVDRGAYEFIILNTPPIADAGPDQTAYAGIDGKAQVTLDGAGSNDPDGDQLTYKWTWTIDDVEYETDGVNPTIELPVAEHTIELIVNDGLEDSEPDQVVITVIGPIKSHLRIVPRVINRQSRKPHVLGIIRLPAGIAKDHLSDEPVVLYPANCEQGIESMRQHVLQRDSFGSVRTSVLAFFDKAQLMDAIAEDGRVQLQVLGRLKTGRYFYGPDTIRIINRPQR